MVAPKATAKAKNWQTRTIIDRFARKVEEVLGENILNPDSPAREEKVGDVLDWLIQADYGMTISYTGPDGQTHFVTRDGPVDG